MMPKSAKRFSDHIMRQDTGMMPKSAKRFSDNTMRKDGRMAAKRVKLVVCGNRGYA
jgi:hypothetical protein